MSYIDANYVRANRILPSSLSSGGTTFTDTSGGVGAGILGGGIVQVCWGRFDSRSSFIANNTGTRVGPSLGWQVEINPRSSSNKMMVYVQWSGEITETHNHTMGITRRVGGTYTNIGPLDTDGNRNSGIACPYMTFASSVGNNGSTPACATYWVLDEPGTTAEIQYMPWVRDTSGSTSTMYINRTISDIDNAQYEAMISTMMVWEVSF